MPKNFLAFEIEIGESHWEGFELDRENRVQGCGAFRPWKKFTIPRYGNTMKTFLEGGWYGFDEWRAVPQ
jgi:hypothetical protein